MFDRDGGHFENSCHYQGLGITQIIMVSNLLRKHKDVLLPESVLSKDFIEKATKVLCFMITPLGNYAPVGDTEATKPPKIFPDHSRPNSYSNYQFALSCGLEGKPIKDRCMVLSESGWAFYRNKWQDKNDFYLLAKCGYKSDYHRQDDDTSFVLCYKGEEWITDGGLYNYQESDNDRKFIRSCHAHSVSIPENFTPIRKLNKYKGKSTINGGLNVSGVFAIDMSSEVFPAFKVSRKITINDNCNFTVVDNIKAKEAEAKHSFRSRFVVPPDKKILVENGYIDILGRGLTLRISISTSAPFNIEKNEIKVSKERALNN